MPLLERHISQLLALRKPSQQRHEDALLEARWGELRRTFGATLERPLEGTAAARGPCLSLSGSGGWCGRGHPLPLQLLPELEVRASKPPEERQKADLLAIISSLRYFAACIDVEAELLKLIARAAQWRSCVPGEAVIDEGQMESYLMLQLCGHAGIVLEEREGLALLAPPAKAPRKTVLRTRPGNTVGELPYGAWRATGAVATSPPGNEPSVCGGAAFLLVHRDDFFRASALEREQTQRRRVRAMQAIPLLLELGADKLELIASCMQDRTARRGEVLARQGEEASRFHVLISGEAVTVRTLERIGSGDSERPMPFVTAHLRAPNYFGERALHCTREGYTASVQASEVCEVSSVASTELASILGPTLLAELRDGAEEPHLQDDEILREAMMHEHWCRYKAALVASILADRETRRRGAGTASDVKRAVRTLKPMHPQIQPLFHSDTQTARSDRAGGRWTDDGFRTPVPKHALADVRSWAARREYAQQILSGRASTPTDEVILQQLRCMPGGKDWKGNGATRRQAEARVEASSRRCTRPTTPLSPGTASTDRPRQPSTPEPVQNALRRAAAARAGAPLRPVSRRAILGRSSSVAALDSLSVRTEARPPRPATATTVPRPRKPARFVTTASERLQACSLHRSASVPTPASGCRMPLASPPDGQAVAGGPDGCGQEEDQVPVHRSDGGGRSL